MLFRLLKYFIDIQVEKSRKDTIMEKLIENLKIKDIWKLLKNLLLLPCHLYKNILSQSQE